MLKKALLPLLGMLTVAIVSAWYINFSPQRTSVSTTYQYKKPSSTYQFQRLAEDNTRVTLPAAGHWQDDFSELTNTVLGLSGQFNIFSKTMDLDDRPIEGNFATQDMIRKGGSSAGHKGISYLQRSIQSNNDQATFNNDTLILGSSFKYLHPTATDGRSTINGLKLNQTPKVLRQDTDNNEYLDIDTELARLSSVSKIIANHSKNNNATVENKWGGTITIDASHIPSEDNVKYLTVKASDFPGYSLSIKGISDVEKVVITIDTSGVNNFSTGSMAFDSVSKSKNIMFNFYNIDSETNYTGNVDWQSNNKETSNAILSPEGIVILSGIGTFNGNIVAHKYVGNNTFPTSSTFPDLQLPIDRNNDVSPKLISAPDVDFGSHKMNSETSLIGNWKGNCQVSGEKGKEIKINVELAKQFTSENGSFANDVSWQLVKSDYSSGSLTTSLQDFTTTSARINYWPWQDDGTGNLLSDWSYNKEKKQYSFYDMQVSNLDTITEIGNYTATLRWTLVDSP